MPTYAGSDGSDLHYDELGSDVDGDGLTLIALAGGAAFHPRYLGDLAGLSERHRLVIPHLRGVGRTPLPDAAEAASYWHQADDLERLRLHLGLDRLHLIAHSAGARLAIAYAIRFCASLAGMVLITPPAAHILGVPAEFNEPLEPARPDPALDAAQAAWAAGPASHDEPGYRMWREQTGRLGYAGWGAVEQAHAAASEGTLAANRAFFSVEPPVDLSAELSRVTAPVLVIAGAEDHGSSVAPLMSLSQLFPSGSLAVITACGHHPWVEQPAAFRQAVDRFLASSRQPL